MENLAPDKLYEPVTVSENDFLGRFLSYLSGISGISGKPFLQNLLANQLPPSQKFSWRPLSRPANGSTTPFSKIFKKPPL